MDIIIMMLIVGFIVFMVSKNSVNYEKKMALIEQKRKECPPHKWTYKKQPGSDDEYMICERCKIFPGGEYMEVENDEN